MCIRDSILGCSKKVTPAVLSQRYSLPPPPVGAAATNGSTLAVAEFQGQVWDQSDLDHFASECKGSISWNVTVDHEAGKVAPGNICKSKPRHTPASALRGRV